MATGPPYLSSTSVVDSRPADVSANAFIKKPLLREDQVQNAVEFISHPRVRGSPAVYRRSFLEKKCLTKEEIDEAFRRVHDLPSNATDGETYTTEHVMPRVLPATLQHQGRIQTPRLTDVPVGVVSLAPTLQQPMFKWPQALLAAGVVAASGAGTALLFKKKVIPTFKVWNKKIVGEEIETKEDSPGCKLAKEAAEAAKAAAAAAAAAVAAVAKASEELIITKIEERKYYDALMGTLDVQFKEIKSMGEAICRLENRIEDGFPVGSITNELSSHVKQSDHINVCGISNTNFEEVCSPLPLALVESLFTPTRISDTQPREAAQQQSIYALQSQPNDHRSSGSGTKESYGSSYEVTGNDNDASEPWLSKKRTKISEVEPQVEKKQFNGRLKERGWLPPRPAAFVLPEAADVIQRPKLPLEQKLSGDAQSVATSNDMEWKTSTLCYAAEAKTPGSMPFGT